MKSYLTILWYDDVAALLATWSYILSAWYSLYWVLFFIYEWRELIITKYQLLCIYLWLHNDMFLCWIRPVNRTYASIVIKFLSATTQLENTLQGRYMSIMASQITGHRAFAQQFALVSIKETSELRVTVPLWGEFTGGGWIPRAKGQ